MKFVWKFPIPVDDIVTVDMPRGAKILHVAEQRGVPHLWALVTQGEPLERRTFRFAGTGHPIEDRHAETFVGTFTMQGGALVFHLFEVG